MTPPPDIQDPVASLLWLGRELAADPRSGIVLSEGNVSARLDDQRFLVKASGAYLETLTAADLTECRTQDMIRILEAPLLDSHGLSRMIREAQTDPDARRASWESPFHAYLLTVPGVNFVAHCHPEGLLQILCSPAAERFAEHRAFPDEVEQCGSSAIYVPYTDPGVPLAREIRSKVTLFQRRSQSRIPRLILIQNHGAIAIGPTAEATLAALLMAEKSARVFVGAARLGGPLFLPPQHVIRLEPRAEDAPRISTIRL